MKQNELLLIKLVIAQANMISKVAEYYEKRDAFLDNWLKEKNKSL